MYGAFYVIDRSPGKDEMFIEKIKPNYKSPVSYDMHNFGFVKERKIYKSLVINSFHLIASKNKH